MPSKINHEISVLRGESEDTGEVFTSSMADLESSIETMSLAIKELESEHLSLERKESLSSNIANKALRLANSSIQKNTPTSITDLTFEGTIHNITISLAGHITYTEDVHYVVDTYNGDAADDLDIISTSSAKTGQIIILSQANIGRTVTIKNGATIHLNGGDFTFTDIYERLILIFTGSMWSSIS